MIISYIKKLINNSNDYKFKEIKVYGEKINYIYNEVLTNSSLINDLILKYVVKLNKKDIDKIDISIEDEKIYLKLEDKSKGIFSGFVDISIFNIKTSYVGYIENDEKRIERFGD